MKRNTKSLTRANAHSSVNSSNQHSPTKRVIHNGMIMMKMTIKITKTKRSSNQMIALNGVIIDTKKASDAQPVNTSAKFVQKLDLSQKCVNSKMRNSSTSRQFEHIQRIHHSLRCQMNPSIMPLKRTSHLMMTLFTTI